MPCQSYSRRVARWPFRSPQVYINSSVPPSLNLIFLHHNLITTSIQHTSKLSTPNQNKPNKPSQWIPSSRVPTTFPRRSSRLLLAPRRRPTSRSPRTLMPPSALAPPLPRTLWATSWTRASTTPRARPTSRLSKQPRP